MPSIDRMAYLLALALLPGLASCVTPEPLQKAGSDNAAMEKDTAECRAAAQADAVRLHPRGASVPTLGGAGLMMSQQHDDNNRAVAEARAFQACMQTRGYARPPVAK
jgi:hypothetical protein